jgi:hypothetical protein
MTHKSGAFLPTQAPLYEYTYAFRLDLLTIGYRGGMPDDHERAALPPERSD